MDRLLAMQIFARVVERGSFAGAAQALELSRARASEAVQALEAALGTRLLERTTRSVSLTDAGRAYYARVSRILSDVAEAEADVVRARGSPGGRLAVDMPMALARLFVVPKLPALFRRYPALELELRLENRVIDLAREGVDCAVTYGKPDDPELIVRRVARTHLVTCAAPSYLARRGTPRTPEELTSHRSVAFLGLATARPSAWEFSRAGVPIFHRPRGSLGVNSMEACVDAAAAGLGVTQVLSSVAHAALSDGRLKPILLDALAEGPALYVAYPASRAASARLRVFVDFVVAAFAEVDAASHVATRPRKGAARVRKRR